MSRTKKKKSVPDWVSEPLRDFADHITKLGQFMDISVRGISLLQGVPNMIKALINISDLEGDSESSNENKEKLKRAKKEALFAKEEIEKGFPFLHAQAAITLWCYIESLIRLFLARWITHTAPISENEKLKKLKITLGYYESLSEDEKGFYILDLLEESIGARKYAGLERFERLLQVFGLSGNLKKEFKKDLFELYHVRNVLVHRKGISDRKIVESCPWLKLSINKPVIVDNKSFGRYMNAGCGYCIALADRLSVHYGITKPKKKSLKRSLK